ncbi:MAG TPA: response regulator [Candidatus Krumholzibacteria bacterium]|nr:response regulator [Candidatus Krumholzibacteria bacterium]HPD72148.1 response regulator [Candidatus Krumholzibacteria bacterium]HRY40920.1 response regulator [Candidatus Krumholzibacteria bacterium]
MASILVIEDDQEVREYLVAVLSRAGHTVAAACNGRDGVSMFRERPTQVVITDIIMPEKDGIETLLDLRRDHPRLKVIAISGGGRSTPENYLHSARLLGADRAIRKPFKNEEILAAVAELAGE